MANKALFNSSSLVQNNAGGNAYAMSPEHALAQLAATGTLNDTFYTSAVEQLDTVLDMCSKCTPEYVAQVAIYARESGFMKDMPAVLCAYLSNNPIVEKIFPRVIDNGKMIRNYVQIMRSGKVGGRKSLGTRPKRLIQQWFATRDADKIFYQSTGNSPSMVDVIKLSHPKPVSKEHNALFKYLMGKEVKNNLPVLVKRYESLKAGKSKSTTGLPWEMVTGLNLTPEVWKEIAKSSTWTQTRMNLNTFKRHGVFDNKELLTEIVARLKNPELIRKARVFPYQLMAAFTNATDIPVQVSNALQDAMEIAVENVPQINGQVFVFPDVSGSMASPVTGYRSTATSKVNCVDVAGLVASVFMRKNENTVVIPFDIQCHLRATKLNPRDSIMTNARTLSKFGGGGTSCHLPLAYLNSERRKGDLIVYISDNESWCEPQSYRATATYAEWLKFKKNNPNAKMVCIDIQANTTTTVKNTNDILNIGGFSDTVFSQIASFVSGEQKDWVSEIKEIKI